MRNGNKGTIGNRIERRLKSKKCSKCGKLFMESTGTKCPSCGGRLKDTKVIIWN